MGGGPSQSQISAKENAAYYKGRAQALQKLNEQLKELIKKKQQAQKPEEAAKVINQMKQKIWASYRQISYPKNVGGFKNVIFIGRTSVGKSSLLNVTFKPEKKLKTSKGRCTSQISIVGTFGNVRIYDCPGFDTDFDLTQHPEKIPNYLGEMDVIYYLYENPEKDIVRTCLEMKKEIYLVRAKCDPEDTPQENQQLRVKDCERFKQLGVQNPKIFFTSKFGGEDNDKLLEHILNQSALRKQK